MDLKNMDRRQFMRLVNAGAVTLGSLGIASGALGQQRIFRVAYWTGPRHPLAANILEPLGKQLNDADLGFNARVFGAGSVGGGGPAQAFERLVNGISHVELHLPGYTPTQFMRTLIVEAPLQYANSLDATKAMNAIYDKHLAQEFKGVRMLGLFAIDLPAVMTNKIVRTPDDLKGLKLRTPSRNQADVITALGAVPVAMPITQAYGAIERGTVDGSIVGISVVNSYKLAEVVKNYIIDLPFGYSPIFFAVNEAAYNALNDKQRAKFDELTKDFSMMGAESYHKEREAGIKTVRERSDTQIIELTDDERAQWVKKLEPVNEDWAKAYEKQGIDFRGILNDYLAVKPS